MGCTARCVLLSVDFAEIEALQAAGDWPAAGALLAADAAAVQAAGADLVLLCTNTMHRVAPALEAVLDVPLLHIADVTAAAVTAAGGHGRPARDRLHHGAALRADRLADGGLQVLVPGPDDRAEVHRVIYDELCRGVVSPASRAALVAAVERLVADGAQGVVLGCTELELLLGPGDVAVPVFATTALHVQAALAAALDTAPR